MNVKLTKVKECRRLTGWGWLLVIGCLGLFGYIWAVKIHGFLAVYKPLDAKIWVVEGYVLDAALPGVAEAARQNPDLIIVCAGLPIEKGGLCTAYDSYADFNAAALLAEGLDSSRIIAAPAQDTDKERTYLTALAVKEKLQKMGYNEGNINVVCLGTHARRSWLLYRKAFKPDRNVGVITYPNNTYPADAWWKNSNGARDVLYEMFAYLYCLIFFHP